MRSIYLDTKHQIYWLSYEYFLKYNISENTLSQWSKRDVCKRMYLDGKAYINYDTIPEPTRVKLPTKEEIKAEYNRQKIDYLEIWFTKELQTAYKSIRVPEWTRIIRADEAYQGLTTEQYVSFARKASVIERAVFIQDNSGKPGFLDALFYAYCSIYPNDYSLKNNLCRALKKAREEGVLSVAIDKRIFRKTEPKYGKLHQGIAFKILNHSKAFTIPQSYDFFVEVCKKMNLGIPNFDWIRQFYRKNKTLLDRNRLGESAWQDKNRTYAKIIPALNRNSQWQMDGWKVPVFCKRPNGKGGYILYDRPTLFVVMDAHSRRIIGWELSESENTQTIMKGLEDAVCKTGVLPYEIVADNHSWNKTKVSEYLKEKTEKQGVHWTIDSNPRRKAIIERSFRTLGDCHFKKRYGYIGQGIRSKMKHGRTQQELIDLYTKNTDMFLNYDQMKVLCLAVIEEYNNTKIKKLGLSPNEAYEQSTDSHSSKIDDFARLSIFLQESEHKVTHGQITIKNGMHTYEYQLPADYSVLYNSKTVRVRYASFEEIYLYDLQTDESICSISSKSNIYGAKADQTESDIENLQKNSGRIKGITTKTRKKKEIIFDGINDISADANEYVNIITAPKDAVDEIRQSQILRSEAQKRGVIIDNVEVLPQIEEDLDKAMKPRIKENKSPFRTKGEVELKKIILED